MERCRGSDLLLAELLYRRPYCHVKLQQIQQQRVKVRNGHLVAYSLICSSWKRSYPSASAMEVRPLCIYMITPVLTLLIKKFVHLWGPIMMGPYNIRVCNVATLNNVGDLTVCGKSAVSSPFHSHGLTGLRAWITNYINHFVGDVITHPCHKFNGGYTKWPLKFRHGWVITSHCFIWM